MPGPHPLGLARADEATYGAGPHQQFDVSSSRRQSVAEYHGGRGRLFLNLIGNRWIAHGYLTLCGMAANVIELLSGANDHAAAWLFTLARRGGPDDGGYCVVHHLTFEGIH